MKKVLLIALVFYLTGCEPEVGSPEWCQKMDATPSGEWSSNEAIDYAQHCILQ